MTRYVVSVEEMRSGRTHCGPQYDVLLLEDTASRYPYIRYCLIQNFEER
jgi:hypothetical protein